MSRHLASATLVGAAILLGGRASAGDPEPPTRDVALPECPELAAPPRVAVGADGRIVLAMQVAGGIDVLLASAGGGAVFGAPVRAVRRDGLMGGGRRGVRVAVAGSTILLAAITKRAGGVGGDLLAWRSTDGGVTWSDAVTVGDVPGCAAEGLFDLAGLGDGRFVVVWLDVRKRGTRLAADFSGDGAAWGTDVIAYTSPDGSICECCAPAVTAVADGGAVAAFRNSVGGERDIWTLRLARGAPVFGWAGKCGQGSWRLAACPMAAPSLAAEGRDIVSAWRREDHVFLATGDRAERDLGKGDEPQVALRGDGVHALWLDGNTLVQLAPGASSPVRVAAGAAYPSVGATTDPKGPCYVTWTDTASRRPRLGVLR